MRLIGLTGGIASGKSTAARLFRERGVAVIDADLLARELVAPGQPALAEIATRWPEVVPGGPIAGRLDRGALARLVFARPAERLALEAILHPRLRAEAGRRAAARAGAGDPYCLYEAALIFETGGQRELQGVIVVSADQERQRERLTQRDQLTPEEITLRLSSQWPLADKRRLATWILENDGPESELPGQVELLDQQLRALAGVPG